MFKVLQNCLKPSKLIKTGSNLPSLKWFSFWTGSLSTATSTNQRIRRLKKGWTLFPTIKKRNSKLRIGRLTKIPTNRLMWTALSPRKIKTNWLMKMVNLHCSIKLNKIRRSKSKSHLMSLKKRRKKSKLSKEIRRTSLIHKETKVLRRRPSPEWNYFLIFLKISKTIQSKNVTSFCWQILVKIRASSKKSSTWFTLITKSKCTFHTKPSRPTLKYCWISGFSSSIIRTFSYQKGSGPTRQPIISKNWLSTDSGSISKTFHNSIIGSLIFSALTTKNSLQDYKKEKSTIRKKQISSKNNFLKLSNPLWKICSS